VPERLVVEGDDTHRHDPERRDGQVIVSRRTLQR
jgi:hypothetical protein